MIYLIVMLIMVFSFAVGMKYKENQIEENIRENSNFRLNNKIYIIKRQKEILDISRKIYFN